MTDDQWQGYCRRYRETLKECALYYIDRGWAVLPLYGIGRDGNCACGNPDCDSPGKHPYTPLAPRGVKNATTLAKDVERWFRDTEGSLEPLNIGIAAGAASKLAILDVDPGHGGEVSLKKYDVPKTLIVNTGGGGTHYYFKHPGGDVRNSAGKLGPGLDVRGSNGYVAAPPSRHRSGKQYKFAPNDRGIADPRGIELADCPDWIVSTHRQEADRGTEQPGSEAQGKGDSPIIREGARNQGLTSYGGKFRKMGMDYQGIVAALVQINRNQCDPPLPAAEVKRIAQSVSGYEPGDPPKNQNEKALVSAIVRCYKDIEPEELQWLWPNRIPLRKISLIAGDPGIGKSFLSMYMAAIVTTGRYWPDSHWQQTPEDVEMYRARKRSVIVTSCEDDPADTIRPRFDAAGGDPAKLYDLRTVQDGENVRGIDLTKDMYVIETAIKDIGDVGLIIVDPLSAFLGRTDSHKDAEVRGVLAGLARLAEENNAAVVGIMHLNKNSSAKTTYRLLGSMGFYAAARAIWVVTTDPDDPDEDNPRRLLLPEKANLARRQDGLAYRLTDGAVQFDDGNVHIDTSTALDPDGERNKAIGKAVKWLKTKFRKDWFGPIASEAVYQEAEDAGHEARTIRRARKKLAAPVKYVGAGKDKVSFWAPPGFGFDSYSKADLDKLAEPIRKLRNGGLIVSDTDGRSGDDPAPLPRCPEAGKTEPDATVDGQDDPRTKQSNSGEDGGTVN